MTLGSENIVWTSTKDSRAAGKISVLACAEVVFSVAAYWWIAWTFDTYLHLIVSICVAPLVLLRSDRAVAFGVQSFLAWRKNDTTISLGSLKGLSIIAFATIASFTICWPLFEDWLANHRSWSLYWRAVVVGWVVINVGAALALAIGGATAGAAAGVAQITFTTSVAPVVIGLVAIAVFALGVSGVTVVNLLQQEDYSVEVVVATSAVTLVSLWIASIAAAGSFAALVTVAITVGVVGVTVGTLVRAILTRIFAAILFFSDGLAALPDNWRRILFTDDVAYTPELLPGVHDTAPSYTASGMIREMRAEDEPMSQLLQAISIPFLFLPSILYRYSIKSTAWLYFPILYVATIPNRLRRPEDRLRQAGAQTAKLIEWVRAIAAMVTLLTAALAIVLPILAQQGLAQALEQAGLGQVPIQVVSVILVLDFAEIHLHPWQYFTLPGALLTVILFFWQNALAKDFQHGAPNYGLGWQSRAALHVSYLRNLLVWCWIALAFWYALEAFHARCDLPDWAQSVMNLGFGPCTPPDAAGALPLPAAAQG